MTETGKLDIGRCFNDAFEVFKKNLLFLILATMVLQVVGISTLFLVGLLLVGPFFGGYCWMLLNSMRSEEKKVSFGDMFQKFNKFLPLLGLFFLQGILVFAGLILLIIPGLFLAAMWLYTYFYIVDKDQGVISSMKMSWNMVKEKGFGMNLLLCIIYIAITAVPGYIPYIGLVLSWFAVPFGALLITSAYVQQAGEVKIETGEVPPGPEQNQPVQ